MNGWTNYFNGWMKSEQVSEYAAATHRVLCWDRRNYLAARLVLGWKVKLYTCTHTYKFTNLQILMHFSWPDRKVRRSSKRGNHLVFVVIAVIAIVAGKVVRPRKQLLPPHWRTFFYTFRWEDQSQSADLII